MADPHQNFEKDIDRFDDIFHQYGDDMDEDKDINVDFDNLYTIFGKDNNNDDENKLEIELLNDTKNILVDPTVEEEEHLSQKLSQLSAIDKEQEDIDKSKRSTIKKRPTLTPSTTTDNISKKMKQNEEEQLNSIVPRYLSSNNQAFEQMINPVLQKTRSSISIEYLREIALLIHQLECIDLDRLLWTTYLRSGTGTLKPQATTTLFLWPAEVKTKMITRGRTTVSDPNEIDYDSCLDYVQRVLRKFQSQTEHYQAQLKERKQHLNNCWTCEIEEAIMKFVQQHIIPLYKVPIEGQIVTVEYDYNDRLIELEYKQQNPNEYQKQIFEDLTRAKYEKETAKFDVAILKQRIVYNHLPQSFESLQIPAPISLDTITDTYIRQRLTDRYEKILQRTKSEMMMVYIATVETKMNEYQKKFDIDLAKMKENQHTDPSDKKLTRTISDGQELDWIDRRSILIQKSNITCSPTVIQDTPHRLSREQVKFLDRGPAYVPPCQIHILSKSSLTLAQIVTKQMAPIRQELTKLFTKYSIDLSRRMKFEKEIQLSFNDSFLRSIPGVLEERTLYEKQLIQSIRYHLKKDQLILRRTADEMNTYYLGRLDEFNQKSDEYVENSTCYELIGTTDGTHTEQQQQQLHEIIISINSQLEQLYQKKLINKDHLTKFSINKRLKFILPYLYFLPETNEDVHMSVQPRFSSYQHSPIQQLAQYLDQLLRPLFYSFSRSTTFLNSGDFMQKLQHYYIQSNLFLPETHVATFKIYDLYTKISHTALLDALHSFLVSPLITGRHQRLSSDAIVELTSLVLKNNTFTYNGKAYRFIKGSPLNLPLTELLASIYLHHWQVPLVRNVRMKDVFYGRYNDMGFITWNASIEELQIIFDELQQELDSNLQMTTFIGSDVHFLHAFIENQNGRLYTRVSHDSISQPFLLPYAHTHPRLFHRQWFRAALIRAGQYCSSFEDFEEERLYLELTFLANGYSLDFVEYHLRQFFSRFNPKPNEPMHLNRFKYLAFHRELFRYVDQQRHDLGEEQELHKNRQLIQLHYLFDWGSRCQFNGKFYQLWSEILEQDSQFKKYGLKVKLITKHCYSSNTLLTQLNTHT
ncbi:unnamed protein product [Rotaria sp. Silwood2]|nr:unnamed protein product [Rotaria sp. Silwood2]